MGESRQRRIDAVGNRRHGDGGVCDREYSGVAGARLAAHRGSGTFFGGTSPRQFWPSRGRKSARPLPGRRDVFAARHDGVCGGMPIGLLLFKTGHVVAAVHQLAVLFSAGGLTPLAVGLFLWQQLAGTRQTSQRIVALGIALAGIVLLVAGVVLAWPEPVAMLPTALLVAAVLSGVAVRYRLAEIHCGAVACLLFAWLTAWHLAAGRLAWRRGRRGARAACVHLRRERASLVPFAGLCFAAAAIAGRWPRRADDAMAIAISAGGVSALGAGLISWFGFGVAGDPLHATWIYALYGFAACIAAARRRQRDVLASWLLSIGEALTLAACVQGVVYLAADRWPLASPWATAFALDATLMAVAAMARRGFSRAALAASLAMLVCTAAASVGIPHAVSAGPLAIHWLWLAAIWLALALLGAWPKSLFAAFQAALAVATWFGVGVWLETRPWFDGAPRPWLDPWTLQAEGIALALLCLAWMCVRRFIQSHRVAALMADAPPVDSALLRLVFLGFVALSCYAAWPGVAQELTLARNYRRRCRGGASASGRQASNGSIYRMRMHKDGEVGCCWRSWLRRWRRRGRWFGIGIRLRTSSWRCSWPARWRRVGGSRNWPSPRHFAGMRFSF